MDDKQLQRNIRQAIGNYNNSHGFSIIFFFYALLIGGFLGSLTTVVLMKFNIHNSGYSLLVGFVSFVIALYFVINKPVIGLFIGAIATLIVALGLSYITYQSSNNMLGYSIFVFLLIVLVSYLTHKAAIDDLTNNL